DRPAEFFAAGVAAAMFTGGITGHGDGATMQIARMPGPTEEACIRELFRGAEFVPLAAPTWRSARYGPAAPPVPMPVETDPVDDANTVRIHAMVGDTQAVAINYRHNDSVWRPNGINGWKTVMQSGPAVLLARR